jgi:hypothetical protein
VYAVQSKGHARSDAPDIAPDSGAPRAGFVRKFGRKSGLLLEEYASAP